MKEEMTSFDQLEIIKNEEIKDSLLVFYSEDISESSSEYEFTSSVFTKQIQELSDIGYKTIRRCRRDGDCFYRGVGFLLVEVTKNHIPLIENIKAILVKAGYEEIVTETFVSVLEDLFNTRTKEEALNDMMMNEEIGNSIVFLMRLLTCAELKISWDDYSPFLEDSSMGKDLFVQRNVEPLGQYADHIQTVALSRSLDLPLRIFSLDQTVEDIPWTDTIKGLIPKAFLLFRPGHYDILYNY
eukprot:GHVP01067462.1.p1 GENE.GHVP01067462.1~~GHVP01067462.1.p1  ORF type:complete len:241 (-),score=41.14 GHVP01067462.1:1066-1788(-)